MAARTRAGSKFRVSASFPQQNVEVTVEVIANNWAAALGRGARLIKKAPELRKRKVQALSLTCVKIAQDAAQIERIAGEQQTMPAIAEPVTPTPTPEG